VRSARSRCALTGAMIARLAPRWLRACWPRDPPAEVRTQALGLLALAGPPIPLSP
jgi:hypothetical protein